MKIIWTAMLVMAVLLAAGCNSPEASRSASTAPGVGLKELTLNLGDKVTLTAVRIPAGTFLMGSAITEKGRNNGEVPHNATISKPFFMGQTLVTVDQFAAFVKESEYKTDAENSGWSNGMNITESRVRGLRMEGLSWQHPMFAQRGDHPVVQVSWYDAEAFCVWLSKKSAWTVYLPTETQWEYACRAGRQTAYPWGEAPEGGRGWANVGDKSLQGILTSERTSVEYFTWDDGYVYTSPVKSFRPNSWGLYDMIGNVSQWCGKAEGENETGAATHPSEPVAGDSRVLRGSSWNGLPARSRSAARHYGYPAIGDCAIGFRVALAVEVKH